MSPGVFCDAVNDENESAPEESANWDPDTDSLEDMDQVMTAVAYEWNSGPCKCCGITILDLRTDDLAPPPPTPAEAIEKAKSFLEAALSNARLVRRAVPARNELLAAMQAVSRLHRLLNEDHEQIGKAHGWGEERSEHLSEEQYNQLELKSWWPPAYFLEKFAGPDVQETTVKASEEFFTAAEALVDKVDEFIFSRMFDPPPSTGRPRTGFAERYAYRYLAAVGLSPGQIEESLGPLVRKLRAVEELIGLRKFSKSAHPRSLRSTIRRSSPEK